MYGFRPKTPLLTGNLATEDLDLKLQRTTLPVERPLFVRCLFPCLQNWLPVFTLSFLWFIALVLSVLIDHYGCFGFGFVALNQKSLTIVLLTNSCFVFF